MTEKEQEKPRLLTKQEKLAIIHEMIKSYESLPASALAMPVNHYDFCSLLVLIASLFKED